MRALFCVRVSFCVGVCMCFQVACVSVCVCVVRVSLWVLCVFLANWLVSFLGLFVGRLSGLCLPFVLVPLFPVLLLSVLLSVSSCGKTV